MSQRVLRKRHRTKATNRPTPPLAFTLRAPMPLGAGVHARYSVDVGDGKIDRAAWATLIGDLVRSETRGKKAPFARLVGVDTRTLDRWLNQDVDVREESVRAVARNLGRAPMELLVKVGYYRLDEIGAPPEPAVATDEELQRIAQRTDLDEDTKVEIIRMMLKRREEDRRRRDAEMEALIELLNRRRDETA